MIVTSRGYPAGSPRIQAALEAKKSYNCHEMTCIFWGWGGGYLVNGAWPPKMVFGFVFSTPRMARKRGFSESTQIYTNVKIYQKSLQSVANFGGKSLLGVKKNSSATDALNKLNMLPLKERRRVHMGVFVHKLSNGNGSTELMETFQRRTLRNHRYCTRAIERGDTATVAHNTTRSERGTVYRAFKNWNEIPPHVREIPNTSTFKKTYQKHLLSKL